MLKFQFPNDSVFAKFIISAEGVEAGLPGRLKSLYRLKSQHLFVQILFLFIYLLITAVLQLFNTSFAVWLVFDFKKGFGLDNYLFHIAQFH